jgi:outer membrane lipoprotein LolB
MALDHFRAEGKLALRSPEQSESASFLWQQQGERARIELSGPLGVNAATLESDGRELEILQGESRSRWDLSDPAVIYRETGWYLPVAALPYWLRGIPAPGPAVDELALERGRLSRLRQAGWEISVERYERFGDLDLPTRLQLRHDRRSVRLVIRRWQAEAP